VEIIDKELEDDVFAGVAEVSVIRAMNSEEKEKWSHAILSVRNLVKNDTFQIVAKSKGQNVIGSRLVLTNKYNPDGFIERRKARVVAKGYSQRSDVNYQTFACLDSIRLVMTISAQYGLFVHQVDVVTIYLQHI